MTADDLRADEAADSAADISVTDAPHEPAAPGGLRGTASRWLGRFMGVGDAGVSSLGNLATNVLAARALAPGQYGLFAVTVLVGIIGVGLSRSLAGDPLTLLHSADDEPQRRDASRRALGTALVGSALVAPVVATVVCGVVVASGGSTTGGVRLGLALAVAMPVLVGQELLRAVAYAAGRPALAFWNSLSWTLALVVGLAVLGPRDPAAFVLLWGLTAAAGLLVGMARTGVTPAAVSPLPWLRDTWSLSRKLVVDLALTQVTAEGSVVLISMIAGAVEAGLLRKGQIPLTPVIVLTNGMIAMAQPALVRRVAAGASAADLRRRVYLLGGAAAAGSVLLGVLVSLLPTSVMREVVGEGWPQARTLVPVLALYLGLGALAGAQGVALRALGRIGGQLRARYVLTPLSLGIVFVAAHGGAFWSAVGLCASLAAVTGAWAWLLARATSIPTPDPTGGTR